MSKAPINTKTSSYARDREVFLKELRQFNDSKGISNKPAFVNGKEIDLYLFYLLVTQRGGVGRVNQHGGWDTFLRPLQLPNPCVNGSALLRRIYGACLERYERARGPPGRDDDNDMEDDYRRGRGSAIPRYVHTAQADWNRWTSRVAGPSERLALSLLSPMPNEQDFAVNVCTVLAADVSNRLPLTTTPHILDFLLAHAGVYNHPSLRDTIGRSYREARGVAPDEFWRLRAGGGGARELADETKFITSLPSERADLMVQALAAQNTLSDRLLQEPEDDKELLQREPVDEQRHLEPSEDWMSEASDEDQLFAPTLSGGARCVHTQRVMQVASIVRSLSFHEDSLPLLAKHTTLLRFLLLCANCWTGSLRQLGLDTLGNIAQELIIRDPATCLLSRHVLSTVQAALVSQDRARVLAALELLNKLAQNETNEDVLLRCLEPEVYEDTCALLTLRDIMVLVCTLECVYALTSLGERACERAARSAGLVHTLVSLLTVEAQSYGPKACILMRVVETVSGPSEASQPAQQPAQHQAQARAQPSTPTKRQAVAEPTPPATPAPASAPAPSATAAVTPAAAPAVSVQSLHAQQQQVQENEQFGLAWLRAAWEPCAVVSGSGSDAGELYRQYVQCCQKVGRKGLIAPAHFPRLVRSVFGGTVGPTAMSTATGESQVYVGIRARNLANRTASQVTGPSSPILKAQLTSSKQEQVQAVQVKPQQPAASIAEAAGGSAAPSSNTTLIKHLLAHKVSAPHHAQQVAQRQSQQQRLLAQSSSATAPGLTVDPEELIKCSTITSAGVSSSVPSEPESVGKAAIAEENPVAKSEQPMELQLDDNSQSSMKSSQNKMLADLLEKKSSPPVQLQAPTIQITETGQILHVKPETAKDTHHFVQIKNDQGQIIHFKNDQGQIIQIKNDQGQIIQLKNEQGQVYQIKNDSTINQGQIIVKNEQGQLVNVQGGQIVQQGGQIIQQGGQIMQQGGQIMQQGGQIVQTQSGQIVRMQQGGQIIQVQQGGEIIQGGQSNQQANQIIQGGQIIQQGGQMVQQGGQMIQGGVIQGGQIMDGCGSMVQVQGQIVQQGGQLVQVMQGGRAAQPAMAGETIDLDPEEPPAKKAKAELSAAVAIAEGVSKTAANLYAALAASALEDEEDLPPVGRQIAKQVQQPPTASTPAPPLPQPAPHAVQVFDQASAAPGSRVQQPLLQVQPLDVGNVQGVQSMLSATPQQLILQEKPMLPQAPQFIQQPIQQSMQLIAAPGSAQSGLSYITQNLGSSVMQHKTIIIVQGGGGGGSPITLTVNNPGGLDEATLNSLITQASEAITQQHVMQSPGVIQPPQRLQAQPSVITSKQGSVQGGQKLVVQKPGGTGAGQVVTVSAGQQLVTQGGQLMTVSGGQQIVSQGGQLVTVAGGQQIVGQGGQIVTLPGGGQQVLVSGGQVVSGVVGSSGQQQLVMSGGVKPTVVRQPTPQRAVLTTSRPAAPSQNTVVDNHHSVIQKTGGAPKPGASGGTVRHVIRQPVMVGNTKIGEQEIVIRNHEPPIIKDKAAVSKLPATQAPAIPTTVQPGPVAASVPAAARSEDTPWICHWKGCGKTFESASGVFGHAARAHCPPAASGEAPCLWIECDRVPRRTFALLNHLHDRHCTAEALRALQAARRHRQAESDGSKSVSLVYPPNAALAALNKHAVDSLNPRELCHRADTGRPVDTDDNEGPVTKSIRLTAALILRNLIIYSNTGRRQLRIYEHHLSTIALSSVEASRTIAQVLYDMNNI